ncbi:MAG: glycosyltransferase family 2 protein [Bacteroidales bacterium]|nr:glycosyltransferase family 2 protein [Bacteroidales bacterium]
MKLSIIIVNYNVKFYLEQCLLSVLKAVAEIESEIFVVDNASIDDSKAYLMPKFPQVQFIWNDLNVGFSKSNNQAIRMSQGDYVLLLNPDTVLGENTLTTVCQFMDEHPDGGGLGVKMIDRNGTFLPESKRGLPTPWNSFCKMFGLASFLPKSELFGQYRLLYLDENEIHQVDVLSGAFMLMRKEALDKSGLLDEAFFMYGEDIDLSYRIQLAGYRNYYLPETIIHYKGESTKKESLKYIRTFYGAMLIFYKKHYPKHSAYFSLVVKLALSFHSAFSFLRNQLSRKLTSNNISSEILLPRDGESFSAMIARIEKKSTIH